MTAPTVRRATDADAEELTRLRVLMNTELGHPEPTPEYLVACADHFRKRTQADDFVAVVVDAGDGPGGPLLASGCGWIDYHLPSYADHSGRGGYIASMSTNKDSRGKGYARLVMDELLVWFREQGIAYVDLHASSFGEPLYRQYGFDDPRSKGLTLKL